MKKLLISLVVLSVVTVACGDDDDAAATSEPPDSAIQITAEEQEWCALTDASEETALRMDQIFEAGLGLSLPMDALNAQASELRTGFETEGMSADEAITEVSELLLQEPAFVEACQAAYAKLNGG